MATATKKSKLKGVSLEGLIMHKPITMSERDKGAEILVSDKYLDKMTNISSEEIKWLARLETMAYILDGSLPNVDAKPIEFFCKKYKRLVISRKGGGQKNIVQLYKPEAEEEKKERSLKDKLIGREAK